MSKKRPFLKPCPDCGAPVDWAVEDTCPDCLYFWPFSYGGAPVHSSEDYSHMGDL